MSIIKSGVTVASYTLLSRIFGLFRELVIANFFGTNMFADAVNTSFKFPNLFRRIFGEGALASVFVPIYSSDLIESETKATRFASEVFSLLIISLTILTALFQFFMPQIMGLIAPGFKDPKQFELSILLCRITIPYMLFISAAALLGGMMNSHRHFASFAFVPIILNIAIISSSMIKGDDTEKAIYVAIGILTGGILQFIFMVFSTRQVKIQYSFLSPKHLSADSYKFLRNMIPATIGSSVTQINLFVSQAIASFAPGAISILSYSDRIYQFPLSIIGICFGTVLLPSLSSLHKAGKKYEAIQLQTDAIKLSMFLSLACSAGIIALAHPIMHIIYERGEFTSLDTIKTAETIAIFSLGLPAFIIGKVITPIFYAKLDTKTPLKITTASIIFNIIANFLLIEDYQHLGISIGTTFASWFNVILLIIYCRKQKIKILSESIFFYLFKTIIASITMGVALHISLKYFEQFLYSDNSLIKFSTLLIIIASGATLYFLVSILFGIITKNDFKKLFKREKTSSSCT